MADPLAYFITWTCYGARLHGDERGTVDRFHNVPGTPYIERDENREDVCRQAMSGTPYSLSDSARQIVDAVIRKHCEIRGWPLMELNVRVTHVHVVVNCQQRASPETAMEQFKAWATRRLREARLATPDQRIWTEHGSTRWVDTEESLAKAINYVRNCQ